MTATASDGRTMQQYASGNYYPTRYVQPMNVAVYGVKGGMEDWAYAASWTNLGMSSRACLQQRAIQRTPQL